MNYPTAPIYETTKGAQLLPYLRPSSVQGHNDGHAYASPAAKQAQDPVATKYECPIWFSYLLPPIYQCYGGHPVCNECEAKVKKCPTCQGDLPKKKRKIRSLVLEEIVVGSTFNCRNHLLGCPVKDLRCDQIKSHTTTCLFTEIPYCEQLGINCREKCWTGNLIHHLKYQHGVIGDTFSSNSLPSMEVMQSVPHLKFKGSVCTPYYLEWENQIFIIKTNFSYDENCCSWMVCTVGSTRSENTNAFVNDFVASIKLSSGSGDSQINSLLWRGLTGTLATPFGYNKCTFSVPLKTLKMYSTVSEDTRGAAKSSWSIEIRLQKRNQTPSPTPLLTISQMRPYTESVTRNTLASHTEDFLMDLRSVAVGNEIKSEIKKSPPPLPLRTPSPATTRTSLANFICDYRPTRIYPVLNA